MSPILTALTVALAYHRVLVLAQNDVTIIGTTLSPATTTSKDVSAATAGTATTPHIPATITITVNRVENKFAPENATADVGDIVKFEFWPTNNSVARSDVAYPCVPYALTGVSKAGLGFWTGFKPIVANLAQVNVSELPAFYMVINRITPLFFYNSAPGACIDHQMVGVINPANPSQLSLQKKAAAAATMALSPGDPIPQGSSISSFDAATATATATSANSQANRTSISSGSVAGIVIGCLAFCALVGAAIWSLRHARRRFAREKREEKEPDLTSLGPTPRSPVTPATAVSELPAGPMEGVLIGGRGGWWQGPGRGGGHLVGPPWAPDAGSAVLEPRQGRMGQANLAVVSELSAYGEVRKDQVPSTPPDKKLPVLPEEPGRQKGLYELDS